MRPFKNMSKSILKKSRGSDNNAIPNQDIEGSSRMRNQSWTRTANWTDSLDAILLSLMTEEHTLGNYVNGSFTNLAWIRIISDFNSRTNQNLTKEQIKNRLKVLKRTYMTYQNLVNKSGWGWDYVNNIPTAGDPSDWEAIIAENPAYAKCRDKPFPAYKDIEFLSEKTTATGRYGFTSGMAATPTIDSSSSSSPGEDDTLIGVGMSAINLLPSPFEPGSSSSPMNANVPANNLSRSPSPPPMQPNAGASASGSGHSSAGKRTRSPQASNPPRKHASSSAGRRKKSDTASEAVAEMVEIGKQKLDLVRQMYQNEVTNRPNIPSIEVCMSRVYNLPGITNVQALAAGDALKDDKNRQLFMTMNDDLAFMWVDRQVAMQNILYKQYFPGQ